MIDQYPFEGFTDQYPETEPTPDWFGFGHKHYEQRTHPVKHIVYADGQRRAVIEVNCELQDGCVERQIMDRLKGSDAERPHINIASGMSYSRAQGAGHWGEPMTKMPDTRPGRRQPGQGWGIRAGRRF